MHLLITGAKGQLGHDVTEAALNRGYAPLALAHDQLNITDADSVSQAIAAGQPDLVINCAAYTAVDRAEEEPQLAFAVNRDGAANLAEACAKRRIPLIHVSTDYVFNGGQEEPYLETDPVDPINTYGLSKAAGEAEVQARTERFIILRTAWVFGVHGGNFVKTMLRLGLGQETLRVVDDQFGCPTFTGHLAEAIMQIAAHYRHKAACPWGIYHYGGQPPINWYGFAKSIFALARDMGLPMKIQNLTAIPTSEYPLPAKRAANSILDVRKIKRVFGVAAGPWQEGVRAVARSVYNASMADN
jgi:dTDP-4-dehydrorhamnose reductase